MLKGGEGFWAQKAKEIPEKFPVNHVVPAPDVFPLKVQNKTT